MCFHKQNSGSVASLGMSSTPCAFYNHLAATIKAPVAAAPGKSSGNGRHSPLIAVREGPPDRLKGMRVSRYYAPSSAWYDMHKARSLLRFFVLLYFVARLFAAE
ncbi:hypothetical protein HBH70_207950 [Parastagonospora nodorum]|nr:hypothetical protein HBH53_064360 [Parastagonospora nodorum]KAH3999623.1 hypothetical protein HBI10_111610 [Parastagonospora nodorum]KAH4014583.1 hypothetical protein HBI13_167940 [Parastagonospora nodorum]KAH4065927.1 hypothetical protein HBH50_152430 [Parastagonospora nodorum]KAH4079470.1 hypothetical protein HBH48_219210 [Parastagonospora nodorum]